ncbi:MAG TPA: hypothetical protein PKC09_13130, partial [Paracoccus sp. (in: a-proteobacteria)]|nr:hypothetical protein [Paracoccus sp. (in: a-proteobacteria)]HMR37209.1 hypothetical protein [Paracoccus sp. (in: a-proteobacteria)]
YESHLRQNGNPESPQSLGDFGRKVQRNFMIDPDMVASLDTQDSKNVPVNEALRKVLGVGSIS